MKLILPQRQFTKVPLLEGTRQAEGSRMPPLGCGLVNLPAWEAGRLVPRG